MTVRRALSRLGCGLAVLSVLYAFQPPFRQYPGVEYRRFELTPDWEEKTEWAFARLMFPQARMTDIAAASMETGGRVCLSGRRIIRARTATFRRRSGV